MSRLSSPALRRLVDFVLPTGCVACRAWIPLPEGDEEPPIVCERCRSRLAVASWPRCPRCHAPRGTGRSSAPDCLECRPWPPELTRARYAHVLVPPATDLVHALKYEGWRELADTMGAAMAGAAERCAEGLVPHCRTPLHSRAAASATHPLRERVPHGVSPPRNSAAITRRRSLPARRCGPLGADADFCNEVLGQQPGGVAGGPPASSRWIVVPVPTTAKRVEERGYNQAHLLAVVVAARLGRPLVSALERTSAPTSQTTLSPHARRENVRGAFRVRHAPRPGSNVLLVDDVLTTGATACEAARTLVAGGARSVSLVTFGRALPRSA